MAFTYGLELEDGTPAEPRTLNTATSSWHPGDEIPLGPGKALRVIGKLPALERDGAPVLVVEPAS
jgi:hypothetical protein